jgi:hypothetical protein
VSVGKSATANDTGVIRGQQNQEYYKMEKDYQSKKVEEDLWNQYAAKK